MKNKMNYIKITAKSFWHIIPCKPGVYLIHYLDNEDNPVELSRLFGTDISGTLYIGQSNNLKDRLRMLWRVLQPNLKATAHTFGKKYNTNKTLQKNIPLNQLGITIVECKQPKTEETKRLESYLKTHGELPPFNSSISRSNE